MRTQTTKGPERRVDDGHPEAAVGTRAAAGIAANQMHFLWIIIVIATVLVLAAIVIGLVIRWAFHIILNVTLPTRINGTYRRCVEVIAFTVETQPCSGCEGINV
jgi:hypothetical protein